MNALKTNTRSILLLTTLLLSALLTLGCGSERKSVKKGDVSPVEQSQAAYADAGPVTEPAPQPEQPPAAAAPTPENPQTNTPGTANTETAAASAPEDSSSSTTETKTAEKASDTSGNEVVVNADGTQTKTTSPSECQKIPSELAGLAGAALIEALLAKGGDFSGVDDNLDQDILQKTSAVNCASEIIN